MTKKELLSKLKALGKISDEQRNEVTCALIGHSGIQTACFGYYNCARCGAQLGDTLGGCYPEAEQAVVVGHNCDKCRENFANLDWRSTIFAPDPFAVEPETTP